MPRKHYNVSQRAESVARAAIKQMTRVRTNFTEGAKQLVFETARREWAKGYRTALKEVRRNFRNDGNQHDAADQLSMFLNDTNRLK